MEPVSRLAARDGLALPAAVVDVVAPPGALADAVALLAAPSSVARHAVREAAEHCFVAVGSAAVVAQPESPGLAGHSALAVDCSVAVAALPDSPGPRDHSVLAANCSAAVGPESAAARQAAH